MKTEEEKKSLKFEKYEFSKSFPTQNGTWYHLSVHAAPKFVITPKDVVYVGIGDNIILPCQVDNDDNLNFTTFYYIALKIVENLKCK